MAQCALAVAPVGRIDDETFGNGMSKARETL
jgi:hypothetical protein